MKFTFHQTLNDMKTLCTALLLLLVSFANAQTDTLTDQSFNRSYDKSCAFVSLGTWRSGTGNQPIGMHWRRVASEFDISPEAKTTYLMARKQGQTGLGLALGGLSAYLSGTIFLISGLQNTLFTPNNFDTHLGIGLGMYVGAVALSSTSISYTKNANNNFEKALWLRNREAIMTDLPATVQPQFKQVYEQEAIYLYDRSTWQPYEYIKNGQPYRLGFLGVAGQNAFQGSVQGLDSYQKYQRSKLGGVALYTLGLVAMLSSISVQKAGNTEGWKLPYFGGAVVASIGGGVLVQSITHLRRAIYFRNRDVVRQRLMFQ